MLVSVEGRAALLALPSSPIALKQLSLPHRLSVPVLQGSETPSCPNTFRHALQSQ